MRGFPSRNANARSLVWSATLILAIMSFAAGFGVRQCLPDRGPVPAAQASDVVGYRVLADLDGSYLVEIRQRYVTNNPLPLGDSPVELLVPHVVVLNSREFEALRLTLGEENVPLSNQQTQ